MKTEAFDKIATLKSHAQGLRNFRTKYNKLREDSRNDKMGEGFNLDSRFCSFTAKLSFDTWLGTYGNSCCQTLMHLDSDVGRDYLVKAANKHRDLILTTMAELMEKDAVALVEKAQAEVAAMTQKLAEVMQSDPTPTKESAV